jgi:hypothetical protein
MTAVEMTTEQIAARLVNAAIAYAESQPSLEPKIVRVELKKLGRTAEGHYAIVAGGTVSKVPVIVPVDPESLTGSIEPGEVLAALTKAVRGESDVPSAELWLALGDWGMLSRPTVYECRTLSRALNTVTAARLGVLLSIRDLT